MKYLCYQALFDNLVQIHLIEFTTTLLSHNLHKAI